mmetsp:Transcript_7968/g.16761  ORF Transcript_7968/g.16761 Transcript_7968/m.16761 type:complete len:125 (+) Transcript_7968:466-840(+)
MTDVSDLRTSVTFQYCCGQTAKRMMLIDGTMVKLSSCCTLLSIILVWTDLADKVHGFGLDSQKARAKSVTFENGRRSVLSLLVGAALLTNAAEEALAFENRISNKYDDRPKRRGPVVGFHFSHA